MNNIVQRITTILGSGPAIVGFALWLAFHSITDWDYLAFISEAAILIGLLILRDESAQAERFERLIKQTKADTKEDLRKSKELMELIKRGQKYER